MPRRAVVQLATVCDNRCGFCAQAGLEIADPDDLAGVLVEARAHADEITFVGGEPTLRADLVDLVARAHALGFAAIGIQTHARALADGHRIRALCSAGLTDVHVSVHAATAAAHDFHVGVDGAFASARAALERLRGESCTVAATTVLTRSNMRILGELPTWLVAHGVAAWAIAVPMAAGRASDDFDRVVPRLGLAIPFALHAIDRARKLGLPAALAGAPTCLLGPFGAQLPAVARAYAAPCEGCGARPSCPGIDATYLARWGSEELRPLAHAVHGEPMPAALARMFVGVGPLAERSAAMHPSPAAARRSLPVIGRVQPAVDEVRGRSQPDPEALRDIFPALFDDE